MPPPAPASSAAMQNENIVVAVRVRPFTSQEVERGEDVSAFEIQPSTHTLIQRLTSQTSKKSRIPIPSSSSSLTSLSSAPSPAATPLHFQCDRLFTSDDSTAAVYDGCVRSIVDSALRGMNGTIFAYGQTASGKTYTMKGDAHSPGLIPLSMLHVFSSILHRIREKWLLRVSYLEIYQEKIRDLLNPSSDDLKVHVSRERGAHVEPREVVVRSVEEVLAALEEGERQRHYGQTLMNDFSSRSHTIFRLVIENKPQPASPSSSSTLTPTTPSTSYAPPPSRRKEKVRVSILNFVDLAGSERQSQTQAQGHRLREALFINKSLLNLGLVISKLGEGGKGGGEVPYRDSKLTHILSGSLGGNSRVVLVCNVSVGVVNSEHSVGTLRFGQRCARVRQCAQVNEVSGDEAEINRYEGKIRQLQNRLSVLPSPTPHLAPPPHPDESKEAVWEERRLLAEDRLKVEEERLRLEQQITQFRDLIMTNSNAGAGVAPSQAALRKRRATFGDGRVSGEWGGGGGKGVGGEVAESSAASSTPALSAAQDEYFRAEQRERKVASLQDKVERLERLLSELSGENEALMRETEEMEGEAEAMTARLEEVVREREALGRARDEAVRRAEVEGVRRRRWQEGEGVDGLSDEELAEMRRGIEVVRGRVERQVLWREWCRERGGAGEDAGRMERERLLREEVAALKQTAAQGAEEQQREEGVRGAAMEEVRGERQRLMEEREAQARRVEELERAVQGLQERATGLEREVVGWEGRAQAVEAECRRVKEENADYSRRLLDVIRPAGPPASAKLGREVSSSSDAATLPASVSYHSYAPPSPVVQSVQGASAMMSAHLPSSMPPPPPPPALSLDDLMGHHAPSHSLSFNSSSLSAPSALPLHDITAHAVNGVQSSPARAETPTFGRPPSPFLLSAGKSSVKAAATNFGSAGKRPAASQSKRK